jgi:hypothetical protein
MDSSLTTRVTAPVDWPELVKEYAAAGQSAARFCRERGIKYSTFLYWQRKIAGLKPRAFVAVQTEEYLPYKIMLPHGLSITCPHLPEPRWLGQLLQEL